MVLNGFTGPVPLQLSYCLYELHDTVRRGDNARHVHARTVQPSLLYSIASQGGGGRAGTRQSESSGSPPITPLTAEVQSPEPWLSRCRGCRG
jgi:hypothetical protein